MHNSRNIVLISLLIIGILVILLAWNPAANRQKTSEHPILVYCAAGMKPPVDVVAKKYEEEYGTPIRLQYGGSGTLLNNLRIAGKGDLYLAADETYIKMARDRGLVEEAIPLATVHPVIVVRKGNKKGIHSVTDLLRKDVSIGLGNPSAASVGRVTKKILEGSGLWKKIEAHTRVFKPTVNDIANDVKIGSVDAGIVWDAVARQYDDLEIVEFPEGRKAVQRITIGVLKTSDSPTAALRFARYLGARDRGLPEFKREGYEPVDGDIWEEVPKLVLFSGGVNRLAIEDTIKRFEKREGAEITRVYNGCGILVAQMKTGKIPDAYFACDVSFMDQVADLFYDPINVAETDMVIVVPKGNPKKILSLADLTGQGLKIGLANPKQSALGALTVRLLKGAGLLDAVEKNVVVKTPTADLLINQIRTGSLDAVIVYRANTPYVRDDLDLVSIDLPNATAIQPYAVCRNSPHKYLMQRLLKAIESEQSKNLFKEIGFRIQKELGNSS